MLISIFLNQFIYTFNLISVPRRAKIRRFQKSPHGKHHIEGYLPNKRFQPIKVEHSPSTVCDTPLSEYEEFSPNNETDLDSPYLPSERFENPPKSSSFLNHLPPLESFSNHINSNSADKNELIPKENYENGEIEDQKLGNKSEQNEINESSKSAEETPDQNLSSNVNENEDHHYKELDFKTDTKTKNVDEIHNLDLQPNNECEVNGCSEA